MVNSAYKSLYDVDKNNVNINTDYKSFRNFGNAINNQVNSPFNSANPLTYTMFPTMGNQFQHGSSVSANLNTTYNPRAQSFISQRCSIRWDGFCEAYRILNQDTYWPNSAVVDSVAYTNAQSFLRNNRPTVGEVMIRNAISRKFLDFPFETPNREQFDPNTANSPEILLYSNYINSPSYIKDLSSIDFSQDEHIRLLLEYPTPCFDVIVRLYLGYIRKEPTTSSIKNTPLDTYFKNNKNLIESFLDENFKRIPSYQLLGNQVVQMSTCTSKKRNY